MIAKILTWIPKNLATIIALAQVVVKFLKEVLTGIVNILFPIIPIDKFKEVVLKVREWVNKIDAILQKIKDWLLGLGIG